MDGCVFVLRLPQGVLQCMYDGFVHACVFVLGVPPGKESCITANLLGADKKSPTSCVKPLLLSCKLPLHLRPLIALHLPTLLPGPLSHTLPLLPFSRLHFPLACKVCVCVLLQVCHLVKGALPRGVNCGLEHLLWVSSGVCVCMCAMMPPIMQALHVISTN